MTTRSIGTLDLGRPARELEDAELWESFRMRGLSPEQATFQVQRRSRLRTQVSEGQQKEFENLLPGKLSTIAVNFGHGASLGLEGDKTFLAASRAAHPMTALGSDIAGGTAIGAVIGGLPIFAGASPAITGAVVGGGTSAARGFFEPLPGLSRTESAALFGAGGVVGGAVMGRIIAKFAPWLTKVGNNTLQFFARALGKRVTDPEVVVLTEAILRRNLSGQGIKGEALERMIQQWKATPVAEPATPVMRPGETLSPIPGEPKGMQVTGTAPPLSKGPFPATIGEIQGVIPPSQPVAPTPTPGVQSPTASVAQPLGNVDPNDLNVMAAAVQRARFPITSDDLVRMSEAKGIGVEHAAQNLRRFGYQVPDEVVAEAKRLTVQVASPTAGTGQTLPWYPRGGAAQQQVAPFPATSPPTQGAVNPQAQMTAFVDFLKGAKNPAEAVSRLGTLRDLGIQGLPQEADLLAALGFARPQ